jgi:2-polyprenyl-3-methyl-5-hydroxy-6-metoxy-1,4-benzoquinol methylase
MPVRHNITDWEQLADWWDAKLGDEGDLWHRAVIDPTLLPMLGDLRGQRVLDLACGNGYLARRLARAGAIVTGVDAAEAIIRHARRREAAEPLGITYHVADAAKLEGLADGSFDVVVCHMALMDIADAEGALREAARVLQPHGRLVASLCHPCFDVVNGAAWEIERTSAAAPATVWRKVTRYRAVFEGRFFWRIGQEQVSTVAYHRPLSWYFRVLRAAGFAVTAFEEPEPTPEFVAADIEGPWIAEIPLHCVFEARKFPYADLDSATRR